MSSNKINNYKELLSRVESVATEKELDLSSGEDLSIGIMNLISIEEHLFFTFNKTSDGKYLSLLNEIRKTRTELMKEIIKDYEGEVWCISKHLLAASMRVMEVGTKELKKGQNEKARSLFEKSYKLYSLFWGINLSIKDPKNLKNTKENKKVLLTNDPTTKNHQATINSESVFSKIGRIVQKAIDCCRE